MTTISRTPPPILSPFTSGSVVGPPPLGDGGVVGPPTSAPTAPPTPPPTPPTTPPVAPTVPARPPRTDLSIELVTDVTEAARLVGRASELLAGVPLDDVGSDSTKDLRIRVFKTNLAAQKRLELQLESSSNPADVVSILRRADASLEDANWQLAKKPSPDGRFNGVDVPGAVRDTAEGARLLNELLSSATGGGTTPGAPPTAPPSFPPVGPPTAPPSAPPTTPPWGGGDDTPPAPPSTPPTDSGDDAPPAPPSTPPPSDGGDDSYPADGDFPPINNA